MGTAAVVSRVGGSESVGASDVASCIGSLDAFLERYRPLMARSEQRTHMDVYVGGLLSGLERKSVEPIATMHGLYRRPLQHYIGAGSWSDRSVRDEMRAHVVEELGDPNGVFVLDGSGFHKQGVDSVGVARQWCGRLGKIDNCQVGVFLAYSTPKGHTLLDGQRDPQHAGARLPDARAASPGRKTPALTVALVRFALAKLLHDPPIPATTVARLVTRQLVRNENVRRDRWRAKGLRAPKKVVV